MKILVLVKEVPDMERVKFDSERGVVDRSSAEAEINPFDESALQAAVDLKEQLRMQEGARAGTRPEGDTEAGSHAETEEPAEITVLTMGPPRAEKSLRDAYARGADRCVLLTDRAFGGSDTCATARTLAAAVRRLGGFDLILCGEKSVDGDTAQVGAETAEFLGLPHAYYAERISLSAAEAFVTVENLGGRKQIRRLTLPALVGVTKNIASPKLPTVRRKLESLEIAIETIGMEDLNGLLTADETGFKGSPTKVAKIRVPEELQKENLLIREDADRFIRVVGEKLVERGIIQEGCR